MATISFLTDTKLTEKQGQKLSKIFKEDKQVIEIETYVSKKKSVSNFIKENSK